MSETLYRRMNLTPMELETANAVRPLIQPLPPPLPKVLLPPWRRSIREIDKPPYPELVLDDVRDAWQELQLNRARDAIYKYLHVVYLLITNWNERGQTKDRVARIVKVQGLSPTMAPEPFNVIIYCTSDPDVVDAKTRSKWSRVLRYVQRFDTKKKGFKTFIKNKGGINACASRFAARLGRARPR